MTKEIDDLWKPAAEPNPELLARQLAALNVWLARRVLTVRQAACLLAGVCPPERRLDNRDFGVYLPGLQKWEHSPEIGQKITAENITEIETLINETTLLEGTTPVDFIRLGAKLGLSPPWIDYALHDPECQKYLPLGALDERPDTEPVQRTQKEIASLGGKAKKARDPKRKRFFPVVHELVNMGFQPNEIICDLIDKFGDEPSKNLPSDSTVYNWVNEIKAEAKSESTQDS
ncbi:MAG: hypothetical protein KUG69_14135 [Marinosulfonomonas sp.]|nr:hypothetical protein [Marinosulfonomonas sp.]